MLYSIILSIWGCIPELSKDCIDMTNSGSTYFGILIGAIIGAFITWWVYNRQNKTSQQQDKMLNKIEKLEELHLKTLSRIEVLDRNHDKTLKYILEVDEKLRRVIDKRER